MEVQIISVAIVAIDHLLALCVMVGSAVLVAVSPITLIVAITDLIIIAIALTATDETITIGLRRKVGRLSTPTVGRLAVAVEVLSVVVAVAEAHLAAVVAAALLAEEDKMFEH